MTKEQFKLFVERYGLRAFIAAAILSAFFLQIRLISERLEALPQKNVALLEETQKVFAWLKANTPKGAIVLTPPYEGHRIMAFADRRVIAAGKVYPSETKELARRLRDLSTFFFTTDVAEANRIAETYQAQYIFLPKLARQRLLEFCEPAGACFWATYRDRKDLTPDGKQKTMIGKFLYGGTPSQFIKIWDSPNYLVYRVAARTPPAPCEVSDAAKQEAIRIVRNRESAAADPIFQQRCGVAVSLVSADSIAQIVLKNKPVGEALREAAERLSSANPRIPANAKIQIALWDESQEIYFAPDALRTLLQPDRGYVVSAAGGSRYIFPEAIAAMDFGSAPMVGMLGDGAAETRIGSFPITVWRGTVNGFKNMFGVITLDEMSFTPRLLADRIRLALAIPEVRLRVSERNKQPFDKQKGNPEELLTDFLEKRIQSAHVSGGGSPTIQEIAALMPNVSDEDALALARLIIERQKANGSFDHRYASFPTSLAARALTDALKIARRLGVDPSPYEDALQRALQWLILLQYDDATSSVGQIRKSPLNERVSNEAAANFAIAGTEYLEYLEEKK